MPEPHVLDADAASSAPPVAAGADRRGSVLLMSIVILTLMIAGAGLAVDAGLVVNARNDLQTFADSAARHGAYNVNKGSAAARAAVADMLAKDGIRVTGRALSTADVQVELGKWNVWTNTFEPQIDGSASIDAVRVTTKLDAGASRGVDLMFAKFLGKSQMSVSASAVAAVNKTLEQLEVTAKANPWLAGNAAGTVANQLNPHGFPDYAGTVGNSGSPLSYPLPKIAGSALAFDAIQGSASYDPNAKFVGADGDPTKLRNNRFATGRVRDEDKPYLDMNGDGKPDKNGMPAWYGTANRGRENGKSDLVAPINSVIGVFLGPNEPKPGDEPSTALVFDTAESRNFKVLAPTLNQPFFIGDGRDADGRPQKFVMPPGATRLFLGGMDGYEWSNNQGAYTTVVKEYNKVTLVK